MVKTKSSKMTVFERGSVHNKAITKRSIKQEVRKALNSSSVTEIKRHRSLQNAGVDNVTTYLNLLNANANGTSDLTQRIGDRICITKIEVALSGLLADTTNILRVIMFIWYDDNNLNPPNDSQVFDDTATTTGRIYGGINYDGLSPKGKRMRILYDKRIALSSSRPYLSWNVTKAYKRGIDVQFTAGGSSGVGIPYLAFLSDSSAAAHPTVIAYARVMYSDV